MNVYIETNFKITPTTVYLHIQQISKAFFDEERNFVTDK